MSKKIFSIAVCALTIIVFSSALFACFAADGSLQIYVPDGAPALTVANLFTANKLSGKDVKITITTGADVQAKILNGEADVAVCPTNMAAALYNKGVDYSLVSANLFGLLYLVGNKPVQSLDELAGSVVHSIGKNNTPEFVFKKILAAQGIDYVDSDTPVQGKVALRYYGAGGEIIPRLKSGDISYAILGEPAVTKADVTELFDLQDLWQTATNLDGGYPQAGVFVKNSLLKDGKFTDNLLSALRDNTQFIADNADSVAELLVENGSNDFNGITFTESLINRCNIRCVKASDCKTQIEAYFNAIATANLSFKLPADGFYGR